MSKQAEIIRLCDSLLGDFEHPLASIETIVNKAHHIAEITNRGRYGFFLYCEACGYPKIGGPHDQFLRWTGRWDEETETYAASPAAILERDMKAAEEELSNLRIQAIAANPRQQLEMRLKSDALKKRLQRYRNIIHQTRRLTYNFIANLRMELLFSQQSADIFSSYQAQVDGKIAEAATDAFSKLPAVSERLAAGDTEAISHALTSCRRIIEAFANAVFPPRDEPVTIGGQAIDCSSGRTKNLLRAFIYQSTSSESRRDRLRKNMVELWDRVSAGVHDDVTASEARALVLNTYLLLGELVELEDRQQRQIING